MQGASTLDAAAALSARLEAEDAAGPDDGSLAEQQALSTLQASLVDQKRRLQVACTQMAEYAGSKEEEALRLKEDVLKLSSHLVGAEKAEVEDLLAHVHGTLVSAAAEAAALAKMHRAEAAAARAGEAAAARGAPAAHALPLEPAGAAAAAGGEAMEEDELPSAGAEEAADGSGGGEEFEERARYIPVRLSLKERSRLRLLEAALSVSEYTDKVDVIGYYKSKTQRITAQLKALCAILCGLVTAIDYKFGQELIVDRDFSRNHAFFQATFEVGRRHKVMNPEKMRSDYGKLVYLLQDSQIAEVQALLEFQLVTPLRTVYTTLEAGGALAMLRDPLMAVATAEIDSEGRSRGAVATDIRRKEKAREALARKYAGGGMGEDELLTCLYSVADNNTYLRFNRDPIERMIGYLTRYFSPTRAEEAAFSLGISLGSGGARLSHAHDRQFAYVIQSLTLWREITHDMFKLWYLAESDLLRPGNGYRLTDTGQGLNRVQQAPSVSRAVHAVLARCQRQLGAWVGSSVIHLGDHNVPNALLFIDKYTQVPRILSPIVLCLDGIDGMVARDPGLKGYVEAAFGGPERLKKTILTDFFRHAFDGSGADNFFDAGSCIDGRLTSAWNWCSQIEKKPYFPIFKLTGFSGFDGDWQK